MDHYIASLVAKHAIYQYTALLMFVCIITLIVIIIKKVHKINLLRAEIDNLHIVTASLPEDPNSGFIYYDIIKKKIFYSAAMRNIMKIVNDKNLDSIDLLKSFLKPESFNIVEGFFNNLIIDMTFPMNLENSIVETIDNKKFWITYQPTAKNNNHGFVLWFFIADQLIVSLNDYKDRASSYNKELESILMLLNNINIPIWLRDENHKIRYYNQGYKKLSDAKEKSDFSYMLAQDAKENNIEMSENMNFNISGERKIYEIRELAMSNNNLSIGYGLDATKIEQLKNEIKQHNRALSDFISSSSNAMALFSSDMKLQMWNFSYVKMWDLDEKFMESNPTYPEVLDVLRQKRKLPDHINFADFKRSRINLFKSLTTIHNEFMYLSEGKTIRLIITPHALGGLLFACEDMTDKLVLERSYNTLIAVQDATLNTMHEAVCVIGSNGKLKLHNVVFAKLWKLSNEYLESKPHSNDILKRTEDQFLHAQDFQNFKAAFLGIYEKRSMITQRFEMKSGTIVERYISSLPDGSILVSDLDVTDSALVERSLREKNEALLATDKIKTTFLSNISYHLRSPLTSILGFSEMLYNGILGDLTTEQKEYLNYIKSSSEDLKMLIDDIIELAVLDSGEVKLERSEIELSSLLKNTILSIQGKELSANIKFEFANKNKVIFYADEFRLKQAIYNIGMLILSLSPQNSVINVTIKQMETYIDIIFITNIRMSDNQFMALFDRFNLNLSDSGNEKLKTMNLNVVKKIIEMHDGQISVNKHSPQFELSIKFYNKL
ncbi:MAG: PAS-domain containing protein [Alphaproteobacteria bacterium]|nr:PAS-domain containing protein [Alphaproteobacteria bacterium]OJV15732.1 MAG: hypothetical protein BGO27_07440 [Alphaproteobacteria bacterium 33-17]